MSGDDSHAPGLPTIHDEAGDTPLWVPLLGVALLVLATLYLVIGAAFDDAEEPAAEDSPAVQVEAAPDTEEAGPQ